MAYLRGTTYNKTMNDRIYPNKQNKALLAKINHPKNPYVTKKQLLNMTGKGTQRVHGLQYTGQTKTAASIHSYDIAQSIPKGVDAGDRTSDKIWLTGFRYNFMITNTSTLTAKYFRLMVVKLANPNQALDTAFFESCGTPNDPQDYDLTSGLPRPLYHTWRVNKQKFPVVYHDKWRSIPISDNTITGRDQNCVNIQGYIKLPNIPVNYNNSGVSSESHYPQLKLIYFINDKNGTTTASVEKDSQYFTYFKS